MDRHTKTTEIAATTIPLKDIKLLVISEEPVLLQEPLNDVRHVSNVLNICHNVCNIPVELFASK